MSDPRIVVADGVLKLRANQALDYVITPHIPVQKSGTASRGTGFSSSYQLNVGNIKESPTLISPSTALGWEHAVGAVACVAIAYRSRR
jgi:hypothetical protein